MLNGGELNKLPRDVFRAQVERFHAGKSGRAYTKAELASHLGLDRKTLRKYLREYGVGWPPFSVGQPYLVTDLQRYILYVPPEFTAEFGWRSYQLENHHMRLLQNREGPQLPENGVLELKVLEPLVRGRLSHAEWVSWIYDDAARQRDVTVYLTMNGDMLRWEFR